MQMNNGWRETCQRRQEPWKMQFIESGASNQGP